MSYARQLLDSYQGTVNVDIALLAAAIDAISECAQACTADTDADLGEQDLTEMVRCIRLCLNCTDVCTAAAGVIAATSAGGMPTCRTAGSAPRPAGAASRPAGSFWTP